VAGNVLTTGTGAAGLTVFGASAVVCCCASATPAWPNARGANSRARAAIDFAAVRTWRKSRLCGDGGRWKEIVTGRRCDLGGPGSNDEMARLRDFSALYRAPARAEQTSISAAIISFDSARRL